MGITVSVDVGAVDVDVDIDDFSDQDLISEVEARGYVVFDYAESLLNPVEPFTAEELEALQKMIDDSNPKIGSVLYNIREKLTLV